ncbi:MAG: hypothetical protein R3350_01615 [Saprospiraceae bacterium]|nr:hypothetical protein [Saprospiraceae bacterium]
MNKHRLIFPAVLIFVVILGLFWWWESEEEKVFSETLFERIQTDLLPEVALETDLEQLIGQSEAASARAGEGTEIDPPYQGASFSWYDTTGARQQLDIKVRGRGKSRRRICDFPPMKLNFDKSDLRDMELAPFDKVKLVTHCNGMEDLVLREYLAYRLYNELTEYSFLVQPLKVNYRDSEGKLDPQTYFGLMLEPDDQLANRLGGRILPKDPDKLKGISKKHYCLLTLFQYMIGNTDWNLSLLHNIELIAVDDKAVPVPIPYDFDQSGLVNAPYATPYPSLPIGNVRERLFQWRGKNREGLEEAIAVFLHRKAALFGLVEEVPWLAGESKDDMLQYLQSFYDILENPERLEKEMSVVIK